jgi:murein DD-endopeptidase MepM/ murein hydrolase activator NlpD
MFSYRRICTALLCTPVVLPLTAAIATDLQASRTADELFAALNGIERPQPQPPVARESLAPESPSRESLAFVSDQQRVNSQQYRDPGVVRFGDTLDTIAARYGLSVSQLMRLNPDLNQSPLVVGRQLQVQPSAAGPRVHSLISLRPSRSGGASWPDTPSFERPDASPSNKRWLWPARGVFTSGYGWRWGRMHKGIDIANSVGTPIVAVQEGEVTYAGWNDGGYGYLVEITHPDGSRSLYAHQSRILVEVGEAVRQGQQIGLMGSTGRSTGPHLHFEIHAPGYGAINPIPLLEQPA